MSARRPRHPGALLGALLVSCGCVDLQPGVLYQCETDGGCFQADHVCGSDNLCRPIGGSGGGAAGAQGGGSGGGAEGGGSAGGTTGGGSGGAAGSGGGSAGGGSAGGGSGGGSACIPLDCPTPANLACGILDAGCGVIRNCSALPDGGTRGCPGIGQTFCGAGANPNLCSAPQSCTDGWCWENPLPQGNTLRAVWAASPTAVWAVGDHGTLLFHNGVYWKTQPSPTRVRLNAIHGTAANDIWAAGDDGVVLHYDGAAWTAEPEDPMRLDFYGIAALPGGLVYVGGEAGRFRARTVSGSWNDVTLVSFTRIAALRALSASEVFAVGTGAPNHAARFNGSSWTPVLTPTTGPFTALHGSSTSALYAAGAGCGLAQLVGSSFVGVPGANGCTADARSLSVASPNDIFIGGDEVMTWFDGGRADLFGSRPKVQWLGAMPLDAGHALFVGSNGTIARVTVGVPLSTESTGTTFDVNGVFAINRNAVIAATSDPGRVYQRNVTNFTGKWQPLIGQAGVEPVTAVWGSADGGSIDVVFAVSAEARLGRYTRQTGGFVVNGAPVPPLYAVTHHAGFAHFGGADGGHLRLADGQGVPNVQGVSLTVPTATHTLRGLFSNGTTLHGITSEGAMLTGDGTQWMTTLPLLWPWPMRAVHGTSADQNDPFLVVVGHDGGIFVGESTTELKLSDAGTRTSFSSVWAAASRRAYVAGEGGAVYRFDGTAWQSIAAPTDHDLLGISGVADAGVWAVGKSGTVLFRPQ